MSERREEADALRRTVLALADRIRNEVLDLPDLREGESVLWNVYENAPCPV